MKHGLAGARAIPATSLVLLGALLIGCGGDDLSVAPSGSPTPSAAPSARVASSQAPEVTGVRLTDIAVDTEVRAIVDDLRVRSAPGVGASSAKLEPLLAQGARLFVVAGPTAADGYDWYQVQPFDGGLPFGWVARAARDGEAWLETESRPCPTPPLDATALRALTGFGGLACFGGDEIQLVGDVHCEAADVDRIYGGPDWLRSDRYCEFDIGDATMEILDGGIPGLGLPTTGRALVTGHFDDPGAASCVYALLEPPAPDPASVIVQCRAMLVATDLEAAP